MTENDNQPTASLFERCVTRREMLVTSGGALVGILLVGCGGAGVQAGGPVSGEFVGRGVGFEDVGDLVAPVPLFAILAEAAGEDDEERSVRSYMCDGDRVTEWFWGTVAGNTVDLTSDSGEAQLQADLTPDEATGTFTFSGEEPIEFTASPVTGIGGLYDVVIAPDGAVSGMSFGGNELAAQLVERAADDGSDRTSALEGTVTLPDGEAVDYSYSHEGTSLTPEGIWEPTGEYRYILLPGGGGHGARKGTPTTRGGGRSAQIIGKDMMC